jgi:Stealth protein CR2, conserved region 2/Stealth protein CR3, conserved region 3/Stealth protein CR4, conserved region 4/Stealth protein CR1, conserved region 1
VDLPILGAKAWRRLGRVAGGHRPAAKIDPGLPAPPRDRRELVWGLLEPHLVAADVHVARDTVGRGAAAAVRRRDLARFHRAVLEAGRSHPDLHAYLYRENREISSSRLTEVTLAELESAQWVGIGVDREIGAYSVGADSQFVVLLVERDSYRNRLLAVHSRADRVDWTELFAPLPPDRTAVAGAVEDPPRHRSLDVVYTWVNSADPAWLRDYRQHSDGQIVANTSADNEERYVDRDELRYSLRSVWMFLPFVRHIYIVTANQRPAWLAEHPQVTVVLHRDVFPDSSVLPTFNSHAIEACLHRIPGLSDDFLYFNDDVFLGREVSYSDFFTLAGQAKVRLSPSAYIYHGRPQPKAIPTDWAAYNSVSLIERDFSLRIDRRLQHVPLPLKKGVLDEIEQKYADEVTRTRAARFRSTSDVAIPSMLGQYYAMATRRAVEWPSGSDEYVYLNTGRTTAPHRYAAIMARRPKFFCLNATRYDEIPLAQQAEQVAGFMRSVFPAPAPWEAESADDTR